MELYGFQQNLAKLQMSLEKAQGNYQCLSESRVQVGQAEGRTAVVVICRTAACRPSGLEVTAGSWVSVH